MWGIKWGISQNCETYTLEIRDLVTYGRVGQACHLFKWPLLLQVAQFKKNYLLLGVLGPCCCTDSCLVVESGGCSPAAVPGLLAEVASLAQHRPEETQAHSLWHMGLVALQHVGSSQIRDGTHVSCFGSQILYLWATREAATSSPILKGLLIWQNVN